ncbi:hypothetical protein [Lacticaseibacillus sp. N501-2]|uniref:hypothetical protein n=1 Tax=Lacticaseibacillus salsurae TaxID=3367729 RepID=UPI0038B3AD8D
MHIQHFGSVTLAVCDHLLPATTSALPALAEAKRILARNAPFTYHAINLSQNGQPHYLIETGDDQTQFTLPAGDYATFKMTRANRLALDQFIQQAYATIAQAGYRPAGNYNLETLSNSTFTVQIPVAKA